MISHFTKTQVVLILALVCFAARESRCDVILLPNYLDGVSEGFNDPSLGSDRKTAFEFALNLWGAALQESYAGETVTIDAQFNSLGGTMTSATLGFAGSNGGLTFGGDPLGPNVSRNAPVANHLAGSDVWTFGTTGNEMNGTFNSDVDGATVLGSTTWYYGTDANPTAGTIDFVETALHEIGHGLGFGGTIRPVDSMGDGINNQANIGDAVGANYLNGSTINSFDYFVVRDSDGTPISSLSEADRLAAIEGDNISWNGPNGVAANGGSTPDLYAPNPWRLGSTYSHLDEGDYPTELMSPFATAGTGHAISDLTRAILTDVGWDFQSAAVPEPSSVALLGFCILGVSVHRLRKYRSKSKSENV